jgi:hypothetical protein
MSKSNRGALDFETTSMSGTPKNLPLITARNSNGIHARNSPRVVVGCLEITHINAALAKGAITIHSGTTRERRMPAINVRIAILILNDPTNGFSETCSFIKNIKN